MKNVFIPLMNYIKYTYRITDKTKLNLIVKDVLKKYNLIILKEIKSYIILQIIFIKNIIKVLIMHISYNLIRIFHLNQFLKDMKIKAYKECLYQIKEPHP